VYEVKEIHNERWEYQEKQGFLLFLKHEQNFKFFFIIGNEIQHFDCFYVSGVLNEALMVKENG